ncbi:zeta toxin family protein [Dactylosporangium sucinum]|uniref:UDP-N-acetylglucosamine kinase n=1 Tax=Dactylosporangium sucinum TaxID=1424081 RepID=A0A917WRD3_9ACTN|nr:zeta toxin family protein [Dactylosporangium sucinum]GGM23073.1 hypothetical protein GCM10007977_025370 [Dactylosporangium sucinum]
MNQAHLPEAARRVIFDRAILPSLFGDAQHPAEQDTGARPPVTVLVGGQPGAGKSRLEAELARNLDAVIVDVDQLRAFHPDYARLARSDDRTAAEATHTDVQTWSRWAIAYAIEHGINLIVSTTLRGPGDTAAQIEHHRAAGRDVEVVFLAVDLATSTLGVLQRYAADRADPRLGYGRYTPRAFQEAAYDGLPATAERVEDDQRAHRVHVMRRGGGQPLYTNSLDEGGRWRSPPAARAALTAERNRTWTAAEIAAFDERVAALRAVLPAWLQPDLDAAVADAAPHRLGPPASTSPARLAFPRPPHGLTARTPPPSSPPGGGALPPRPGRTRS